MRSEKKRAEIWFSSREVGPDRSTPEPSPSGWARGWLYDPDSAAEPLEMREDTDPTSVYLLYDDDDVLLYVGVTNRGYHRLHEHAKQKEWFDRVARADFEHLPSRFQALTREAELISTRRPWANKVVPRPPILQDRPKTRRIKGTRAWSGEGGFCGRLIGAEETNELLDRQTRRHFGMSRGEFVAAWESGEIERDDERLRYVANLMGWAVLD